MEVEVNLNKDISSVYELVTDHLDFCEICHNDRNCSKSIICSCNHSFCQDCFLDYYKISKSDFNFYPLSCPAYGCNNDVYKALAQILSSEDYEKFKKLRKHKKLIRNPKIVWCPIINCGGYGINNKKDKILCKECDTEIVQTNLHAEIMSTELSLIECPGCGCLIERTFGCMNAKCYCGIKFCMKCGRENNRSHNDAVCLALDNEGNASCWVLFFAIFSHFLFPLIPLCLVYWYRNHWDRNYLPILNEHPWFYGFVIGVFSPMILVFSLFYLPFIWGWDCVDAMFDGKEAKYKGLWVVLKILLYFPAVFFTFVGWLLALALIIAFAPLYGFGLVGYLMFKGK